MTEFVYTILPSTRSNFETILISLDRGMFADVHQHLTLFLQCWAEPPQNDEVEKR